MCLDFEVLCLIKNILLKRHAVIDICVNNVRFNSEPLENS